MDDRTKKLIAIGSSVTMNCQPCLQYFIGKAREIGIDNEEISIAIAVAKEIRKGATGKMDEFVLSVLDAEYTPEGGCGCGCG